MSETTAATRERWAMERDVRRRVAEEIAAALDERYLANLRTADTETPGIPQEARVGLASGYQRSAQIAREIGGGR